MTRAFIIGLGFLATGFFTSLVHADGVPSPAGLVAWWRGEGNALDSIGTNNGVEIGDVQYVPGKVGQGYVLDGTGGCISVADSPSLNIFTNRITIETWIKANSTDDNPDWAGIVAKGNSSWRLQATSQAKTVTFSLTGTSFGDLVGTHNVNDGQWHHVAAVCDGTNAFLYVDGTLDVSAPVTGTIAQNSDPLCIGANAKAYLVGCDCEGIGYFYNGVRRF